MNASAMEITQALMPEDDRRAFAHGGVAIFFGLWAAWGLSQIEFIIDPRFLERDDPPTAAQVNIVMPDKPKAEVKKPVVKSDLYRRPSHRSSSSGKSNARGKPKAIAGTSVLALIQARSGKMNQDAYNTMNAAMHQDVDKVLKSGARLVTKGNTVIGERKGKATGDFMGELGGGGDGINDVISRLIGDGSAPMATKSVRSITPQERDIQWGSGNEGRSVQEVMQIVRSRTPGLRHIYNRYLKQRPGFQGKVTLRFTILPGGDVVTCDVASSTTGYSEFDNEIRSMVQTWRFKVIKAGHATITIPFQFSE